MLATSMVSLLGYGQTLGGENCSVAQFMLLLRGLNRGSHMTGSTRNQRIERLWPDVYNHCTSLFYHLFYLMKTMVL